MRKLIGEAFGKNPKVKILGNGELTVKLSIERCTVSGTAKEKIEKAKAEVAAFDALPAPSPSTTASTDASLTTTAEVDLAKPRALGDAAIKSVKEARDALQKVVVSIGHNMGVKAGASSEASGTVTN